ncbi:hypothetical protein [Nonomuraea dietziae]|uniref:hypothetical protein n=1 Tax=Nonomuraea dietziae TaxID=65515 RepID=UPI0033ECB101
MTSQYEEVANLIEKLQASIATLDEQIEERARQLAADRIREAEKRFDDCARIAMKLSATSQEMVEVVRERGARIEQIMGLLDEELAQAGPLLRKGWQSLSESEKVARMAESQRRMIRFAQVVGYDSLPTGGGS